MQTYPIKKPKQNFELDHLISDFENIFCQDDYLKSFINKILPYKNIEPLFLQEQFFRECSQLFIDLEVQGLKSVLRKIYYMIIAHHDEIYLSKDSFTVNNVCIGPGFLDSE